MATRKMKLEDWLDDLCVRFIINLPEADLTSMARICFLVEEAHWFYEDFIRPLDHSLPSMNLRNFCLLIFQRCPLLAPFPIQDHVRAFEEFLKYKTSVPVRGAILLNETMDSALLVKGWKKGAHWSFPKGKIAMDEDDLDCAIREVAEETGFDVREAGLVPPPEDIKYIDTTFRDQQIRLYVFRNVPMDTYFEPRTRKEISKIQWYKIADLPTYRKKNNNNNGSQHHTGHETDEPTNVPNANKFYMVAPFIGPLKKWVAFQRKRDAIRAGHDHLAPQLSLVEDALTEDETGAQPEPAQHLQRSGPPPEDILANASRELQRLLKMQPLSSSRPVQAVSGAATASADYADTNQNKANALLAILQKGGDAGAQRSSAAVPPAHGAPGPHTPLEHVYNQAPQPHTPHHHHPVNHPQFPSYQQQQQPPPPPFHLQMPHGGQGQGFSGPAYSQFGAPRPGLSEHQQQEQQFQQQRLQEHQTQHPPLQGFQYQQQTLQQGSTMFSSNVQNRPPPYTSGTSGVLASSTASRHLQQPPPPPIPLLHPQPLPPTVQKALFARESLVSPDVSVAEAGTARRQGNLMMPPPPPPQQRMQQPSLSNQAVSLLNAFKSNGAIRAGEAPAEASGTSAWQEQQPPLEPQQQSELPQLSQGSHAAGVGAQGHQLYGARPQPASQRQYGTLPAGAMPPMVPFTGQGMPSSLGNNNPLGVGPSPTYNGPVKFNTAHRPVQHSEQHRNALLGMFKQQTQQVGAPRTVSPQREIERPGSQRDASQQIAYPDTRTTGQTIEAAAQANGAPIEMNPEMNLPFGALSLLTRPKGLESSSGGVRGVAQAVSHVTQYADRSQQSSAYSTPPVELPAGPLQKQPSFTHQASAQFAGRQRVESSGGSRSSAQGQYDSASLPPGIIRRPSYGSSSSVAPPDGGSFAQAAPQQQQQQALRPEQNPEHKQRLLSLFNQPAAVSPTVPASLAMAPPGVHAHQAPLSASVSSRGSVDHTGKGKGKELGGFPGDATAAPVATSRRGSQTPISPADRNFLLGYLASVSGT